MKNQKRPQRKLEPDFRARRQWGVRRPPPAREEYPDFELGDGSELNLDDPDVGFALSMAKRD